LTQNEKAKKKRCEQGAIHKLHSWIFPIRDFDSHARAGVVSHVGQWSCSSTSSAATSKSAPLMNTDFAALMVQYRFAIPVSRRFIQIKEAISNQVLSIQHSAISQTGNE
jgi:hypothetical protein